ncbi:TonB-dependent receptor [Massilia niastensis]|uniref:TonB-dependent receptor n=1 Tax=Massilia niastensis TaxID=544911 RepID=UPI00036FBACF|nr:TonB-dependent receptor [Massilia niastensis]
MRSSNSSAQAGQAAVFPQTLLVRALRAAFAVALGSGAMAGMAHAGPADAPAAEAAPADAGAGTADSGAFEAAPEPAGAGAGVVLQTVTVTAQKREGRAQDVPSAISVLGGAELLAEGVGRSASEILNYVPNASAGTQQHSRPRWWIRGVGAGQQQLDFPNPVGFYRDDVYISNSSATGFPLFDLERVEVLRGPQGTLWGKNTTGGAINVVSRKPTDYTDGYFKADYSSNETVLLQGALGGSIAGDVLAGRLSFHSEEQREGNFNNLFKGSKDGELNDNAVRGQLRAKINRDFTANLSLHYRDYQVDGATTTTGSYAANGLYRNGYFPSANPKDVSTNAPSVQNIEQRGANLTLDHGFGDYALTSVTGYEDFESDNLGDSDNTPLEISRGRTQARSRQFSQELRLASPKADRVDWVGGLHYFRETIDSDAAVARLPEAQAAGLAGSTQPVGYNNTVYKHKTRSFAVFGSATVDFTDRLLATFGVRWTTETKDLDLRRVQAASGSVAFGSADDWWNSVIGGNYAAPAVARNNFSSNPSTTWRAWTYDFTPQYKIDDNKRVYLKYAHGIKSGGYNTSATDVRALNTVEPEELDSLELGLKSEWLGRRLNLNANLFYYDYRNVQVNITGIFNGDPTQTVNYLQNVERAHVAGAELELEARPTDALHLQASVGLLRTQFDRFQIQNNGGTRNGNEFVRSPHVTALLAADYRIPLAGGGKIVIGADAHYTGKQFYYVDPQTPSRYLLNQPGYTLTNARIIYTAPGGHHVFTVYADNIADKVYKNHTLTAFVPGTTNGDVIYWAPGRRAGASYTYHF